MSRPAEASSPAERVLAAFVDGEPLTVADVAIAADLAEAEARTTLETLVEDGALLHTTVRGVDIRHRKRAEAAEDVDLEAPIDCYYRPPAAVAEGVGSRDGARIDEDADRLDRRLARMDVPGASEMMRDWRRDAVRAAYEYLEEHGPAAPEAIVEAVYPAHEAGFEDSEPWWACVRPRLARLRGVDVDEEGRWLVRG